MSSELLRRAAVKLRDHAAGTSPAPWFYNSYSALFSAPKARVYDDWETGDHSLERYGPCPACAGKSCELYTEDYRRDPLVAHVPSHHGDTAIEHAAKDAAFIELMHPPVALALADLLDIEAGIAEKTEAIGMRLSRSADAVIALARSVLREPEETP